MGNHKYPLLSAKEIEDILISRGFVLDHTKGDHRYYYKEVHGIKCITQVDVGSHGYNADLIKLLLSQTKMTREQFYCSTKTTAKKINKSCACQEELEGWAISKSVA